MKRKKILLVEDHPIMRSGIQYLLRDQEKYTITAEASSCAEMLTAIKQDLFDIILLDLSLPDGFGLDSLPEIRAAQPGAEIIILTMHNEEPYIALALAQGVSGYVLKDMAAEKLLKAIESAELGERVFHLSKSKSAGVVPTAASPKKTPKLSMRERSVMEHLTAGKSLTEIASTLGLSVKTVFTYRVRLFQKLGLESHEDLLRLHATVSPPRDTNI